MTLTEALGVLGLSHSVDEKRLRSRFHELMRLHHPDVAGHLAPEAGRAFDVATITEAYAVASEAFAHSTDGQLPLPSRIADFPGARALNIRVAASHDGETLFLEAPPDEAFQLLYESVSHLGGIGHVDRGLGLLEVVVRFDGGPSCSVLFTLQGRSHGTDIFCEMESIEAAPTPPITPVLDALLEALDQWPPSATF